VTTHTYRDPADEQVDVAVETFKLLADRTRLRILWALLHGEHSVNELAAHVGANPAAVSQHLAKLRLVRLVSVRRDGTRAFYTAEDDHVRQLVEQALFSCRSRHRQGARRQVWRSASKRAVTDASSR
jgi:DNA-binding transcriptional ArsR family regulator